MKCQQQMVFKPSDSLLFKEQNIFALNALRLSTEKCKGISAPKTKQKGKWKGLLKEL